MLVSAFYTLFIIDFFAIYDGRVYSENSSFFFFPLLSSLSQKSDDEYFSNMGINVRPFVIISYVLSFWGNSTVTGSDFKCDKDGKQSYSYTCKPTATDGIFTLPESTPKDVEFLTIKAEDNTTWSITQPDVFKKLSNLDVLHINTTKVWHISNPSNIEKLKQDLFTVPNLQILRVTYLTEYNNASRLWKLTADLKHLYSRNSVLDFDLKTCNNLYSLSLINASLDKIPENNGLNFMGELDLSKNTLKQLTALDLASFCSLETLNLRDAQINDCECKHIRKLFDEMKRHKHLIVQYTCKHTTAKNCTPLSSWPDVKKKRDSCLDNVASKLISLVLKILLIASLVLLITISCCAWLLRYLNKVESS